MKVIFLDIDGVLITHESIRMFQSSRTPDPACIASIQRIADATGAQIVITSTWRLIYSIEIIRSFLLEVFGLRATIRDVTPHLVEPPKAEGGIIVARPRRDEIKAWLSAHPEVTRWVVLDDSSDAGPENLVLTQFATGLTDADADAALVILNKP